MFKALAVPFLTLSLCISLTGLVGYADETISITGPLNLQDADTFEIGPVLIRVHGIDAPEIGQSCQDKDGGTWPCGTVALNRMKELVAQGSLACFPSERDPYGRIVARCTVNDIDLGGTLIDEGLAWPYLEFSKDYEGAAEIPKAHNLGIWQAPTQTAKEYRDDAWARAEEAAPSGRCPIKGNNNRNGKIYHTPWSPNYSQVEVDLDADEFWFCDEAEALAAGWRAPRR